MKMMKKIGVSLLTLCLALSAFLTTDVFNAVEAKTELVNVALLGTAKTENGHNSDKSGNHVVENVNDNDTKTSWQTKGVWPSQVVVELDQGRNISEIAVELGEDGDNSTGRSCLVTIEYAQNGVTDTLLPFGSYRMTVDSRYTFKVDTPKSATHIYVTLSEPQDPNNPNPGFYPSVQEIEVYEEQEVKLSNYNNIASQALKISATGNNEHGTEGSKNLVDKNYGTLYKYYNAAQSAEQSITLEYAEERTMDAFVIYFESVGETDSIGFSFKYSILARKGEGEYTTIVENATANRTDNYTQKYQFDDAVYDEIKIVMHECKTNSGNGWPAIAEFEVYGTEPEVNDKESIAFRKPVHTSSNAATAANITDGSLNTSWSGIYYPSYVDIDLQANYLLDEVQVFTPTNGYSQYSIYTSMDGRDFTKLAEKTSKESTTDAGDIFAANQREARIVRVYLEYNSANTLAVLNEVRVKGTASGTAIQTTPEINVKAFNETAYATNIAVTAEETINEVFGIIERQVGPEYKNWFLLELADNPDGSGYDYFELSMSEGKIHVKGNNGVSLAMGINHYLKYFCNVNISQVGNQNKMPSSIVPVTTTVHKETKAKVRYSYNYCTLSYSMAFWGEDEWRNELDWLALNGVNVVLDATAQEEVWRRFLGKLGYSHADIKDYIAGPAYYAWAYMANLSGFGGPVHDSWFEERTELARKNQEIMRNLGMQPVLQGYSGMVPTNITSLATGQYALSSSDIIGQGKWCSFQRPAMLRTTNEAFDKYAALFYECQKEVYGDTSLYYATDPFHEGGNTGGMNSADIAREVLNSMLTADQDAIWIIQAWQGNPTTALLNGLDQIENGASHALVLDLYAEKTPHYGETGSSYGDTDEFDDTPWLFCMLNNFGGRLGLHGHLDNLANNIPTAFNNRDHIAGIGITPEASVNNPVLYDFLFETIWQNDATQPMQVIDLNTWLDDYATRRYGAESASANAAWDILKETVYKSSLNNRGQGAPESIVNARPATTINAASTWGNAIVGYDKMQLEEAAELLLKDYDKLSASKGYMYDLANVLQQVLSNSAQEYHNRMVAALNANDKAGFESLSQTFLEIIDQMEKVTATSEYFLLGRWVEQAKALGKNADEFTKELYEFNAKALVTTWGSINQCESGGLKDYSNRQWSGLIGDFYKPRWQQWINANINGTSTSFNWFEWEWEWVRGNKVYPTTPTAQDLEALGEKILGLYSSENPAADDSRDISVENDNITVETGSYQPNNDTEGDPKYVLDGNPNTIWHTDWNGSSRDKHYLIFTFNQLETIDSMRFLQRTAKNGRVTKFSLYYRTSIPTTRGVDTTGWTPIITERAMSNAAQWQQFSFEPVEAKQVMLVVNEAESDNAKLFASAAEIRFTSPVSEDEDTTIEVSSVTLDQENVALNISETVTLQAEVLPEDATDKTLTWTSSDDTVAIVVDGVVSALTPGTTTITVTTSNGLTDTCTVTVKQPVVSVSLAQETAEVTEGETLELQASVLPENATDKTLTWTSSDNNVATVSEGVVTALSVGTTTITVTTSNGLTDTCTITVNELPIAVESVTLSQESAEVNVDETLTLQASVLPEDAANKTLTWTSSDEEVATVSDGVVTALSAGTTTITATSNNGLTATCTITVKANRDVLKRIDRTNWQIAVFSTDSVDVIEEHGDNSQPFNRTANGTSEGPAERMIDGNYATHWHDEYDRDPKSSNYSIIVQLNGVKKVAGFELLRRKGGGNGKLVSYTVKAINDSSLVFSNENKSWSDKDWQTIGEGSFSDGTVAAKFNTITEATHIRIDVVGESSFGSASELNLYEMDERSPLKLDNMTFKGTTKSEGRDDFKTIFADGNPTTFWTSNVDNQAIDGTASMVIDLNGYYDLTGFDFTGRYDNGAGNKWNCTGNLLDYKLEVSLDGNTWITVKTGETHKVSYNDEERFNENGRTYYSFLKSGNNDLGYMVEGTTNIEFAPSAAKFIKLTATKSHHWQTNDNKFFTISDLNIYGKKSKGYNIVLKKYNPNIVENTTLRYTDGNLMTGTSDGKTLTTIYNEDRNTNNYFDFGAGYKSGYMEIDLGGYYDVSSINALFYNDNTRRYKDVVVLVSENRKFTLEDIVYNNDLSGKHDLGPALTDDESVDTSAGRTIKFETRRARFIRIYMAGNTSNGGGGNQIVEFEVYGLPSEAPDFIKTISQVEELAKEWLYESTINGESTYVSPDVLRVKAQTEVVTDDSGSRKVNVRFVSSVASENLEQVRFKVEVLNTDGVVTKTGYVTTNKVYEQIAVNDGGSVIFENPQEIFDNPASKYFSIAKLNNVPESARTQRVRVTPCWLPLGYEDTDANYVEGVSRTFVISEFFDHATQTLNVNE